MLQEWPPYYCHRNIWEQTWTWDLALYSPHNVVKKYLTHWSPAGNLLSNVFSSITNTDNWKSICDQMFLKSSENVSRTVHGDFLTTFPLTSVLFAGGWRHGNTLHIPPPIRIRRYLLLRLGVTRGSRFRGGPSRRAPQCVSKYSLIVSQKKASGTMCRLLGQRCHVSWYDLSVCCLWWAWCLIPLHMSLSWKLMTLDQRRTQFSKGCCFQ